ncbi:hypothetical protein NEA10_11040 [Phormidium yuhuli AB48]|uniref:Uncharacterized protein n=1 Tax=Phormidium yuhuli AB48 TaxID=2940671 RepID=A0ABY5AJR3_9CYAN|nr:hypothetical protein [Phormidium yuhuli]USR89428.1 hypothetical protein NEA10_11040 [Phormidium yuhuli AB48]
MVDIILHVTSVVLFAIAGLGLWQVQRGLGSLFLLGLGVMELPYLLIRLILMLEDQSGAIAGGSIAGLSSMFLVSWLDFLSNLGLLLIAVSLYRFVRQARVRRSPP